MRETEDTDDISRWLRPAPTPDHRSAKEQLRDAMRAKGLSPPDELRLDGKFHRWGDRRGDDAHWYIAHGDGIPAGCFGSWRLDLDEQWRAASDRRLTPAEELEVSRRILRAQELRDHERARRQELSASAAATIWEQSGPADPAHPYLRRKGIAPHVARVSGDGRLMLPLYSDDGAISSLQFIDDEGGKRYLSGGRVKGAFALIGSLDGAPTLYLAEGYATGATVHEVTRCPVLVAYSAGNLAAVADMAVATLPGLPLVIVADNDKGGVGLAAAQQAAARTGARYVMPPEEGSDANDYHRAGGDLLALLSPPRTSWLISADDFCSQPAPVRWIVRPWLEAQSLAMVHGASGSGKTFAVLDLAASVAAGLPDWHGHRVHGGPVVYIAGEGHSGLRARLTLWRQERAPGVPLRLWVSSSGADLDTPAGLIRVRDELRSLTEAPSLVVVDTLHRCLAGDENSAQDAKRMIDSCASLQAEFGCTVLLVHHTGVGEFASKRARGSSAWKGALETEIHVSQDSGTIKIEHIKPKNSAPAEAMSLTMSVRPIAGWLDEDGEPVSSVILERSQVREVEEPGLAFDLRRAWWHCGAPVTEDGAPQFDADMLLRWAKESGQKGYRVDVPALARLAPGGVVGGPLGQAMMIERSD